MNPARPKLSRPRTASPNAASPGKASSQDMQLLTGGAQADMQPPAAQARLHVPGRPVPKTCNRPGISNPRKSDTYFQNTSRKIPGWSFGRSCMSRERRFPRHATTCGPAEVACLREGLGPTCKYPLTRAVCMSRERQFPRHASTSGLTEIEFLSNSP